ncbi:hypothetical protein JYQ62_05555 [Nostoc sp. UHCC 0702]|nr:hypothetical protein JYQ62_05555 [Nostoc sp. UHCC 0702]
MTHLRRAGSKEIDEQGSRGAGENVSNSSLLTPDSLPTGVKLLMSRFFLDVQMKLAS